MKRAKEEASSNTFETPSKITSGGNCLNRTSSPLYEQTSKRAKASNSTCEGDSIPAESPQECASVSPAETEACSGVTSSETASSSSVLSPPVIETSNPPSIAAPSTPAQIISAGSPSFPGIPAAAYACLISRATRNVGFDPASPLICDDSGYSPPPSPPPTHIADWLHQFDTFSIPDKHKALDRLLNTCNFDQLRYMYEVIEPQFQLDFISKLPKSVSLKVLSYLSPKDLGKCAQVNHLWRNYSEDSIMWREICRERGVKNPSNLAAYTLLCHCPWKAAYIQDREVDHNWKTLNFDKVLRGHENSVITCLQYHREKVVSGSDDNTLRIWDLKTGIEQHLTGHAGGVWSCEIIDNIVVSGSTDRTLKVWSLESGECLHTLEGHSSTVRCIALNGRVGVSGARDATIRMWDLDQGTEMHTLTGHLAAVRCVAFDGQRVVSGAYDCHVKVWDATSGNCIHTLEGHSQRVYSLQFDGTHAVSGSLDASIIVWNVHEGRMTHTLRGHKSLTSSMVLRNNILISGNADSTVKVWNILNGECLNTLFSSNSRDNHTSAVTSLQFSRNFIVSASDDGSVKLWNLDSGEFVRDLVRLRSSGLGGVVWRIQASDTKLICAVGSRNGTEDTKLLVFDFTCKKFISAYEQDLGTLGLDHCLQSPDHEHEYDVIDEPLTPGGPASPQAEPQVSA